MCLRGSGAPRVSLAAMSSTRLPRSYDEMVEAKNLIFPPSTFERGKTFRPSADDVIITPWSKSGTTWLQQIVHSLRSGGDMDFDDISRISPWIEVADALGVDLDADQGWQPRAFKSHYSYVAVPKGARYLVSFREPRRVMISYYRFYEGWMFEPGTVTIDEYVGVHLKRDRGKDYWTHIESWWGQRDADDVLLLSYELMQADHRPAVAAIADFIGFDADDALIDLATKQSTLEFMLDHGDRFNDLLHRQRATEVEALPEGAGASKVTDGAFDPSAYELSQETVAAMDQHWQDTMGATFGFHSYDELVDRMRSESASTRPPG